MVTFVERATASSSRSDDDAMLVTSWRRSDKEIDAVSPPPFGLMGVAGDLCVARRRRCPCITSSSLLDLPSQAPSANSIVFMERDTKFPWGRKANDKGPCPRFRRVNALLCWEQSGLEPSWGQYTMDPADRISENEEAVREQLSLLFLPCAC